jgi:predicted RNA methylase
VRTVSDRVEGCFLAARSIHSLIDADRPVDRAALNIAMTEAFGGGDASGAWTQRQSFDALEVAVSLWVMAMDARTAPAAELAQISAMTARLPTHTVRSEEQYALQQFSTPADIAWLTAHLATIDPGDIVLEPSAGTGLLAAFAKRAGAALQLNEYDPTRAGLLRQIFAGCPVSEHDGARIATLCAEKPRPSIVLMNPPFSVSLGRGDDRNAGARHLASALNRLERGGRAVAIMPDWFAPGSRMEQVFRTTLDGMTVALSLRLDRGAYAKHGTSVAVRIYVIDKVPGSLTCVTLNRATPAELLAAIPMVPPRAPLASLARAASPGTEKLSLFRSVKFAQPRPVIVRAPQRNEVADVTYTVLDEPAPVGEQQTA